MTRINAGIPPRMLSDKHLLAEHREIKRIPNHFKKHYHATSKKFTIPSHFTLGKGHVLFFIDKGTYTKTRYYQIYAECLARGFQVTFYGDAWTIYDNFPNYNHNYEPTPNDKSLILARLLERDYAHYQNIKPKILVNT
jgi:deoxyribonuclease (pyrimidine dimer)